MAQDDYYYEIQLTNKQLVFYFVAGAAGLVLSFLAGVMVGRGIEDDAVAAAGSTRPVAEERIVAEQASPQPSDYSYPQRLESERPSESLETPAASATATPGPPATRPPEPLPTPAATARPPAATPAPTARPTARSASADLPRPIGSSGAIKGFAVQVGSFKDRASAEVVVRSLRGRGLPAFSVAPAGHGGGFFPVRVGVYRDRVDAKAVQDRLRDDKFQPIIIKQ